MQRSSLAWTCGSNSPISSRNSVPPSALRMKPSVAQSAPVNAPLRWPNNWDSTRVSFNVAQSTARNGLFERGLHAWIYRATSSLPLPDSPRMSTVQDRLLTDSATPHSRSMAGLAMIGLVGPIGIEIWTPI